MFEGFRRKVVAGLRLKFVSRVKIYFTSIDKPFLATTQHKHSFAPNANNNCETEFEVGLLSVENTLARGVNLG